MPVVISDTSPVRALAHLGRLDWLRALFGEVLVPPAVTAELASPPGTLKPVDVSQWSFLLIRSPSDLRRVLELRSVLDAGESEAIALAEELHAELILVDELAGREVARQCGLTILGTLGILVRAKQARLCPSVAPLLERLQKELNFFISSDVRDAILRQAGE